MSIANRLTVRRGPAEQGEAASADSTRRLCRPPAQSAGVASPLCSLGFFGHFTGNFKQNSGNPCSTKRSTCANRPFLCAHSALSCAPMAVSPSYQWGACARNDHMPTPCASQLLLRTMSQLSVIMRLSAKETSL